MRSPAAMDVSTRHHSPLKTGLLRRQSSMFNSSCTKVATAEEEASRIAALEEVSKPNNGRSAPKNVHDEVIAVPRAPRPELKSEKSLLGSADTTLIASSDDVLLVVPAMNSKGERATQATTTSLCEVYACQATGRDGSRVERGKRSPSSILVSLPSAEEPSTNSKKSGGADMWSAASSHHAPLFLPLVCAAPNNVVGAILDAGTGQVRLVVEECAGITHNPTISNASPVTKASRSSGAGEANSQHQSVIERLLSMSDEVKEARQKATAEDQRLFWSIPVPCGRGGHLPTPQTGQGAARNRLRDALREVEGASIHTRPAENMLVIFGGLALAADGQSFNYRRSLISARFPENKDDASVEWRCKVRETPTGGVVYPPGVAFHSACITEEGRMLIFGGMLEAALPRNSSSNNSTTAQPPAWRICGRVCGILAVDDSLPRSSQLLKPSTFSDTPLPAPCSTSSGVNSSADPLIDPSHPEEVVLERNKPLQVLCGNGTYAYDFGTRNWSHMRCVGDVPCGRSHHSSALSGPWMFISGGMTSGAKVCKDLFALHVPTGVWAAVAQEALPPFPTSLMVASPNDLLLFTASRGVFGLNLVDLTAHINAKRRVAVQRIEIAARSAANPDEIVAGKAPVALSRKELELQIARLTYERTLPLHLLDPRVQAVREKQSKAYLSVGVSCPLRTVTFPSSVLAAAADRLHDKDRPSRQELRREAALRKYDRTSSRGEPRTGKKPYMLNQLVQDLYENPRKMYKQRHDERLERCLQLQVEQRQVRRTADPDDSSGVVKDGSFVCGMVTERLYADSEQRLERLEKLTRDTIEKCASPSITSPSSPPDPDLFLRLYRNEASIAERQQLFEELVVKKELQDASRRGGHPKQ